MKYENTPEVIKKKEELKKAIDNLNPLTVLRIIGVQKHYKKIYNTDELVQLLFEYFSMGIFQFSFTEKESSVDTDINSEKEGN